MAGAALASALMAANYPGDSGEDVDRLIAELAKRGYVLAPSGAYVGGHPEMSLHPYISNGSGGCANCEEAATAEA